VYVLIAALAVPGGTSVAARQVTQDSRTLVVGAAFDIKSLDPARAFEPAGVMILKATYDTRSRSTSTTSAKIIPDLAENWEVSPDARTFTFRLRHDVIHSVGCRKHELQNDLRAEVGEP
jgi:peptide/nickel transport system substrate-binding protein